MQKIIEIIILIIDVIDKSLRAIDIVKQKKNNCCPIICIVELK